MTYLQRKNLAYVIGVALGDGNLSNPNGRAVRLRVTCDKKYPHLIEKMCAAIQFLLPKNKVSITRNKPTFLDISCYSNKWESWLGWKVGHGSKYDQNVAVPDWIKNNKAFVKLCLLGLFETDGSIYFDRTYKMAMFVTITPNLARDVFAMITTLGFEPRMYKIKSRIGKARFNIRIARNVNRFVKTICLLKS